MWDFSHPKQRKGHSRVRAETTGSVFGEWPGAVRHTPVKQWGRG
jgi:hypothetical protein